MAFHTVDKTKIFDAVQSVKEKLGLSQGSIYAEANPYAAYDFYTLLEAYIDDPEARLKIHEIVKESRRKKYKI